MAMSFDEYRETQEILTRLAVQLRDMSVLLSEQRERIAEELTQIRMRLARFRDRTATPPAEN
jgi:hypothetical protein